MSLELRAWELAEAERSSCEADHTSSERLRADERQLARYLNPCPATAFPLEYAYALLGDVRGRLVLDFGCGSGENTLLLASRGARVIGVDISERLIQLAVRRLQVNGLAGAAWFVVGSAHELPFESGSVDIVFGIAVLHHLELAPASREVHRVLKPGGRAIFKEPVRDSRLLRAMRRCIPYRAPDVSPFERPLTSGELSAFAAAFRARSVRAFSLPFVNLAGAIAPLRRHLHSAYRLDGAILKRMPALVPFAGIRVLELTK